MPTLPRADLVEVRFTGTVTDSGLPAIESGDPVAGTIVYNSRAECHVFGGPGSSLCDTNSVFDAVVGGFGGRAQGLSMRVYDNDPVHGDFLTWNSVWTVGGGVVRIEGPLFSLAPAQSMNFNLFGLSTDLIVDETPPVSIDAEDFDLAASSLNLIYDAPECCATVAIGFATLDSTIILQDADGDLVGNAEDNCTLVRNDAQIDTNGDGIGNACDADITGPGGVEDCVVNYLDLSAMRLAFFSDPAAPNWNPDADLDASSTIDFLDLQRLRTQFFGPPGPSASGCN